MNSAMSSITPDLTLTMDPALAERLGYSQAVDDCRASRIGQGGLPDDVLRDLLQRLGPGLQRISDAHASGAIPFLRLPGQRADLDALMPIAEHYQKRFDDVLILGTGGSSLGSRALYEMADREADRLRKAPQLHIITNVDPFVWDRLIRRLDYRRTGIIVISKSGGTTETMMQFLSVLPVVLEQLDRDELGRHITLITEPGDSPLRRLSKEYGLPVLDHDPKVGGRYSVLSVVGVLPTLIAGLDAAATREGAERVLQQALESIDNPAQCPAAVGAAISVGLETTKNIAATVMLAYSDRLGSLARWYRQLWAESLGKQGYGTTPVYATGPVDQHSQLQLWLDGPADKMFTILGGPNDLSESAIDPALVTDPRLSYMAGRSMGDLMSASRRATAETLAKRGRPVRRMEMQRIDEGSMGALMMHFMLETVLAADLLGVDPFNQPAVEDGKVLIRRYLSEGML